MTHMKAFVLALCLALALPGISMAAAFGEFASGVKNLTEAAKDINDIKKDKNEPKSEQKQAPSKKQPARQKAPKQDESMRGG